MTWLPIETAPKDGRAILLLSAAHSHNCAGEEIHYPARCAIGKWNAEGDSWVDEYGQQGEDCVYHHLEVTGVWDSGGGWFQPNEVTHWQRLPEPPNGGGSPEPSTLAAAGLVTSDPESRRGEPPNEVVPIEPE